MNLLTPEEVIQKEICPDKPLPMIRRDFHTACQVMDKYKIHILDEYDKCFNKVIGKVNMLLYACMNKDQGGIDSWLAEFSQIYNDDTIGINFRRIIDDTKRSS